ncbi:MAG: UDP-N-acetylmuramate dehydrogenase [Pseudomonadota bacterium]|nr:UDP-N-acetylmuramate dehydrogenase [Pseudomonadota bacterium]
MSLPEIKKNMNLAPFTSWKVGGAAALFSQPQNIGELKELANWAEEKNQSLTILSGGTNVLISDRGIDGLVIQLSNLVGTTQKEDKSHLSVSAFAGTPKSDLTKIFLKKKLAPAIFLAGLPGDVGGGVVMNAGIGDQVIPKEFVEIVEWVEVYDLEQKKLRVYRKDELKWSYRKCEGWQPGVVVQVGFIWPLGEMRDVVEKVFNANRSRAQRQPLQLPSCGSVFKNPLNEKAGHLIESAGLKGYRIGDAEVSEKHANFIVNRGQAKAQDIHQIIEHVKAVVVSKFKVSLETEVVYLGKW